MEKNNPLPPNRARKAKSVEMEDSENSGIANIELKTIESRLEAIKEGILRIRSVLIIITIASSAIFFTIWNANFSRLRYYAFDNPLPVSEKPLVRDGRNLLVSEWYKSRFMNISILGVKVDVGDFSSIGTASLVLITLWFFYSQRQTNRLIFELLKDLSEDEEKSENEFSRNKRNALRKMVYHSITQNSIFIKNDTFHSARDNHKPDSFLGRISNYRNKLFDNPVSRGLDKLLLGKSDRPMYLNKFADIKMEPPTFTDRLVRLMFYLPFWTIIVIIARDVINFFLFVSPVADSSEVLFLHNLKEWSRGNFKGLVDFILYDGFSVICAIYLRVLCNACIAFSRASSENLWEFKKETDKYLNNLQASKKSTETKATKSMLRSNLKNAKAARNEKK